MWLKLTHYDDNIILINMDKMEAVTVSNENNAKASITISGQDTAYSVKETIPYIFEQLSKQQLAPKEPIKGTWE